MKSFVILLATFTLAPAIIEWPFETAEYGANTLNLTIGNPGQNVRVAFQLFEFDPELFLPGPSKEAPNNFNLKKSSTFTQVTKYSQDIQCLHWEYIDGLDDFVIKTRNGTSRIFKQFPFTIEEEENDSADKGRMYLFPTSNRSSFFEQILGQEEEKVVVITHDHIPPNNEGNFSGVLTLGGRPKVCSDKWTTFNTTYDKKQWSFMVDGFKLGNASYDKPQLAIFALGVDYFAVPSHVVETILDKLYDGNGWVPCNITEKMKFKIGDLTMELNPEDYIDRKLEDNGWCILKAYGDAEYMLPSALLREKCVLLNFETKQIGFADKLEL